MNESMKFASWSSHGPWSVTWSLLLQDVSLATGSTGGDSLVAVDAVDADTCLGWDSLGVTTELVRNEQCCSSNANARTRRPRIGVE